MAKQTKPRVTREELDARISARQEKNRARRATRLTGADLERRFAERREQRASRAASMPWTRHLSAALGVAFLLGSGGIAAASAAGTQSYALDSQATAQQIAATQGDLAALPAADQKAAAAYAGTVKAQLARATAKGEQVAALQQQFATILYQGNTEHGTNGGPSPALTASIAQRRLLAPFFEDKALIADDAQAYAPGSVLPFDANRIDPRFPWYVGYTAGSTAAVVDPATSTWRLASVVATPIQGVFETTWLNSSSASGELYAWATANFYVDQAKFGNLKVGTTSIGAAATKFQTAGK